MQSQTQHTPQPASSDSSASSARSSAPLRSWCRKHHDPSQPFAAWIYILLFLVCDFAALQILQWSVSLHQPFDRFWSFIFMPFTTQPQRYTWVLNMIVIGAIYFTFVLLINRFWISTPVFMTIVIICAVIERMKVSVRNEAILPSDLTLVGGGNANNLTDFIPRNSGPIIVAAVLGVIAVCTICAVLYRIDGSPAALFSRRSFARWLGHTPIARRAARIVAQAFSVIAMGGLVTAFALALGTSGTWAHGFAVQLGDQPHLWDSIIDAQGNGTVIGFMRFLHIKVMDEPHGYSEATMKSLATRYEHRAQQINHTRNNNLSDTNVIEILSESFSDPTRVPGLKVNKDPMPWIRGLKGRTTSGYMVSSGYGGGTANLEFQAVTGLSLINFSPSLTSPYQQLVPGMSWTPTFNQLWNQAGGTSLAFHPYAAQMYSRSTNYKKFKISKFWALRGTPYKIHPTTHIDRSPYVDDRSAYTAVLDQLKARATANPRQHNFYQLETMQNHMDYNNWYAHNEFQVSSKPALQSVDEKTQIRTYAKGVEYTDQETRDFLNELDRLNVPVTVIWYGDHLPGIYNTASQDSRNSLALHETDYFIWSNKASHVKTPKLPKKIAQYASPNFFMAMTAAQTGSKVSPYLAFLTDLHEQIPAMEPPVVNVLQDWYRIPKGNALYVNADGQRIEPDRLTARQRQLMADYRLIQYDICAGHHYLRSTDFMQVPHQ
jgi:hypothetical protein